MVLLLAHISRTHVLLLLFLGLTHFGLLSSSAHPLYGLIAGITSLTHVWDILAFPSSDPRLKPALSTLTSIHTCRLNSSAFISPWPALYTCHQETLNRCPTVSIYAHGLQDAHLVQFSASALYTHPTERFGLLPSPLHKDLLFNPLAQAQLKMALAALGYLPHLPLSSTSHALLPLLGSSSPADLRISLEVVILVQSL